MCVLVVDRFRLFYARAMTHSDRVLQSPVDFGAKLRSARKARGLTQAQAAAMAGVGVRLWNEAEKGKRAQVGLETALRMLRAVGVELRLAEPPATGGSVHPPSTVEGPSGSSRHPRMA